MKFKLILTSFLLTFYITSYSQDKVIHNEVVNPTKSAQARDYYNKGVDFSQEKNYTEAIVYYEKAISEDPNYIDAYDNLGLAYRKTGKLNEAEKNYLKSYSLNDKNLNSILNLAVVYGINKNYLKASEFYKKAITLKPQDPEGYYGNCQTLVNAGNQKEALNYCLKTKELYEKQNSPYIGDISYILAIAYYNLGEKINAKKYLNIAKQNNVKIDKNIENVISK